MADQGYSNGHGTSLPNVGDATIPVGRETGKVPTSRSARRGPAPQVCAPVHISRSTLRLASASQRSLCIDQGLYRGTDPVI